jgi:hypothetical protein
VKLEDGLALDSVTTTYFPTITSRIILPEGIGTPDQTSSENQEELFPESYSQSNLNCFNFHGSELISLDEVEQVTSSKKILKNCIFQKDPDETTETACKLVSSMIHLPYFSNPPTHQVTQQQDLEPSIPPNTSQNFINPPLVILERSGLTKPMESMKKEIKSISNRYSGFIFPLLDLFEHATISKFFPWLISKWKSKPGFNRNSLRKSEENSSNTLSSAMSHPPTLSFGMKFLLLLVFCYLVCSPITHSEPISENLEIIFQKDPGKIMEEDVTLASVINHKPELDPQTHQSTFQHQNLHLSKPPDPSQSWIEPPLVTIAKTGLEKYTILQGSTSPQSCTTNSQFTLEFNGDQYFIGVVPSSIVPGLSKMRKKRNNEIGSRRYRYILTVSGSHLAENITKKKYSTIAGGASNLAPLALILGSLNWGFNNKHKPRSISYQSSKQCISRKGSEHLPSFSLVGTQLQTIDVEANCLAWLALNVLDQNFKKKKQQKRISYMVIPITRSEYTSLTHLCPKKKWYVDVEAISFDSLSFASLVQKVNRKPNKSSVNDYLPWKLQTSKNSMSSSSEKVRLEGFCCTGKVARGSVCIAVLVRFQKQENKRPRNRPILKNLSSKENLVVVHSNKSDRISPDSLTFTVCKAEVLRQAGRNRRKSIPTFLLVRLKDNARISAKERSVSPSDSVNKELQRPLGFEPLVCAKEGKGRTEMTSEQLLFPEDRVTSWILEDWRKERGTSKNYDFISLSLGEETKGRRSDTNPFLLQVPRLLDMRINYPLLYLSEAQK